jgi:hypothetical protein
MSPLTVIEISVDYKTWILNSTSDASSTPFFNVLKEGR